MAVQSRTQRRAVPKPGPARQDPQAAPETNDKPAVDFGSLQATDVGHSVSELVTNPYKRLEGTPFETWVRETREEQRAKSVALPDVETANKVAYLLNLAARKAGLGVRIPKPFKLNAKGEVEVIFQGKDRSKHDPNKVRRPSKQRKDESDEEWAHRVMVWEDATCMTWEPTK